MRFATCRWRRGGPIDSAPKVCVLMTKSIAPVWLLALVLGAAAGAPADETPSAPVRFAREPLVQVSGSDGNRTAKTLAEWEPRRRQIRAAFESIAGKFPGDQPRSPLDLKTLEETDCGTYVRRRIEYSSQPGGRVPAYLLIPKSALSGEQPKTPAVLCLHPTDNVNGVKVVVGLGGKANRQYASELAERGFVTLSPSYPLLADYQPDLKTLGWESGTMKAIWDNVRGVDLLDSLPFVAHEAYGVIGHSLGGHNSVYTALFDERLKVVVSSCGLDSFQDYYGGADKVWLPEKGWTQTRYMPRLRDYRGRLAEIPFDFHELIASLAPRHVFIAAPLHDSNFRYDSVDRLAASARPVFELGQAGEHLIVAHPDCDHDFPEAMREKAYLLFQEHLPTGRTSAR